ncbi:MAG TPA: DNA-binding response regulator [Chitinophagaceae bacterium]|nr:DNA-binding response regulator [Chitinophagaceae bacterium]
MKVLVIDDERLAREELKRHLQNHTTFELVGEAADADEAAALITELKPDLLLLDIQMPGRTGFELLESLEWVPAVIFTTAFDAYAVKAFEINALDYLVKPIRDERFAMAVNRVKEQVEREQGEQDTREQGGQDTRGGVQHIFVKEGDRYYMIKTDEISLIESAGNYAKIYFNQQKVLIKKSLNQLEKTLDATVFFRVSRQEIINTTFISQMQALPNGQLAVKLKTGNTLTVSNRQSARLKHKYGSL